VKHAFTKAGQIQKEPVSGSFIYIAAADGAIRVTAIASGQQFIWPDLERGEQVRLPNDINCERIEVVSSIDNNVVHIKVGQGRFYPRMDAAGLVVDRIKEGINVVATATVENGNVSVDNDVKVNGEVSIVAAGINTHKPRVECLPGVATLIVSAGTRKSNRINIRSDQLGGVSLGGSDSVNNGSGGFLDAGMVDYMDTSGELWAFNDGSVSVFVDVLELI